MRKMITFFLFLFLIACKTKNIDCDSSRGISENFPINTRKVEIYEKIGIKSEIETSFNPFFLPVKIVYSSKNGNSIQIEGDNSFITPIGVIEISQSYNMESEMYVNGHKVVGGDYVIGLVNKKANKIYLYKIEGFAKLKVIALGKTQVNAQKGYVEVDITDSKIQELTFVDNSKISIVNNTSQVQKFTWMSTDFSGIEITFSCEVAPYSYKYASLPDESKFYNKLTESKFYITFQGYRNQQLSPEKVSFGDVIHIVNTKEGIEIKKI